MLLCDTGVLLAAGNIKDQAHRACVSAQILPQRPGVRDLGHPRQTAWSTCTAGHIRRYFVRAGDANPAQLAAARRCGERD
jgi:hypothetical protein